MTTSQRLRVGNFAPDFQAPDQLGRLRTLSEEYARRVVVLYFYPKDHSPHCVQHAACFRTRYEQFSQAGAEVFGISHDSVKRHLGFSNKLSLPYTLLSDPDGKIHQLYGVPRRLGILPGRVTYVIGRDGTIQDLFVAQFKVKQHVEKALAAVERIGGALESSAKTG